MSRPSANILRTSPAAAAFRDLLGPVVYVEHDRMAAAAADRAIRPGTGGGRRRGAHHLYGDAGRIVARRYANRVLFQPAGADTASRQRPAPEQFLTLRGAHLRNLCEH